MTLRRDGDDRETHGGASWLIASPYPAASTIALGFTNAVDLVVVPGPRSAKFALFLVCLVLGLGTLHGVLWQALQALVRRLPRVTARCVWPLATFAVGAELALRLGALTRWNGRYHLLAVGVLGACGAGALALGALLAGMQPTVVRPVGFLGHLSARVRWTTALGLLLVAVTLGYADHVLYVGTYALAHTALRVGATWLCMFALVLSDAELKLPRLSRVRLLLLAGVVAIPLVMLDEHESLALQAFAVRPWPAMTLGSARALLDFDGDGYSSLLGGGDCAPFNARIHPGAREIPENGIDDNCVLGDAKRRKDAGETLSSVAGPAPLDVVLITIDTLRPDHLGIYNPAYRGRGRPTTPNLDRWASEATVFRHAYTSGGWTSIALASLMRGLYARRLRWTRYYETNYFHIVRSPRDPRVTKGGEIIAQLFPFAYLDPHKTLPQRLRDRGMYTAGVVDDGPSDMLQRGHGVELGFDEWHETDDLPPDQHYDSGTTQLALKVLQTLPYQKRFFLWVHYFGPHQPDDVHPGIPIYGDTSPDRYDHEITYLDQQLQPLLAALAQRVPAPAVLIMADHGEKFADGGRGHGMDLSEACIRIPLLARVPEWPPGDVNRLVSLVDIAPTVLALTGTPVPANLDGIDLSPLVERGPNESRILLSDTWRYEPNSSPSIDFVGAYDGHRKLVLDRAHQYLLAYDEHDDSVRVSDQEREADPRSRRLYRYLEETGGKLNLGD